MRRDSFVSSPARLNQKLKYHSTILTQRNPGYYRYVYDRLDSSCVDTENHLRDLTYITSPQRSYRNYPLRSNLSTFRYYKAYPSVYNRDRCNTITHYTQCNHCPMTRPLNEKESIINQFCKVSELAMDRLAKLDQLNHSLLAKVNNNANSNEAIKIEEEDIRSIGRGENKDQLKMRSNVDIDNKSILNILSKSVERLERDQEDCRREINTLYYNTRNRYRDSYTQENVFQRSGNTNSYYCPRTKDEDISRSRHELDLKSRENSVAESHYNSKLNDLKFKVSVLERGLDQFKNTQLDCFDQNRKYLFN